MSRRPSQTSSSTNGSSLLTTPDPPHLRRFTAGANTGGAAAAGQQRVRSGSDVLPRSGASSPSSNMPSIAATLTSSNIPIQSGAGRKTGGSYSSTSTTRRSTVTSSPSSSFSPLASLDVASESALSTPAPSMTHATASRSASSGVPAAGLIGGGGGGTAGSELGIVAGSRSAASTPVVSSSQRSELRRNKRKEAPNYHIQLERVLGLTTTRPSALSMNKKLGLVAYAAGCVVVLYDYHRGVQVGSLACSSLTASSTCPPSADDDNRQPGSVSHASSSGSGSAASQYWQPWMNHPMATPFVNPLAGLMPMNASLGGIGGGRGHAGSDLLSPPGGGGLLSSSSPSNRKTDSESASRVPASLKPKPISCLAFSPDGQYLAVGETGHQPRILVWDVIQRVPVVELIGHQFGVQALQFSANGKILISLGFQHDGFVHVWNWWSRLKVATNKVTSKVNALIPYNADGTVTHAGTTSLSFITVGLRHVKFWYLGQTKAHARAGVTDIRLLEGRSAMLGEMRDANFVDAVSSPDGEQTYLMTSSGVLCMLNKDRTMDKFVDLQVRAGYSVSLDDNCIVCACSDGIIRLFEPITLKYHRTLPLPSPLGYSPLINLDSLEPDGRNMYSDVAATLYDAEAERLFSIYGDRSIRTWIIPQDFDAYLHKAHLNHSDCVWGIETVPHSHNISIANNSSLKPDFITFSADGTVRFWGDSSSITGIEERDEQEELSLLHVLYPDPNFHQWLAPPDVQAMDPAGASAPLESGIRVARISAAGGLLATGDRGGNLRVHDLQTMTEITYQEAHENDILAIDFTDPARFAESVEDTGDGVDESMQTLNAPFFVVTAGRDRLVHVFDIRDEFRLVQTLDDHSSSITCLRLTPDGSTLVSGSADKSIVFRSLQDTGDVKYVPYHHAPGKATVHEMAVVPWNGTVTSISGDRRIYVYNLKTGKATKFMKADVPCLDGSSLANTGPTYSLGHGGPSGSSVGSGGSGGGGGGASGISTLPASASLGVVENCSMTHIDLDPSGTIAVASGSDKSIRVYDLMQKVCLARMVCHSELVTGVKLSLSFTHIYSTSGDGCILVWRLSDSLVKKIEARQQMMQEKLATAAAAAASQEQARRMHDGEEGTAADEGEIQDEDMRRKSRQRSLSQSASRQPNSGHSVLPPPLPPARKLSPSPSPAGRGSRFSPSRDRQLSPFIYRDNLSVSDLSSTSRRNSEGSILSEDISDAAASAEEASSSDGLGFQDRRQQAPPLPSQHLFVARPGTPNRRQRVKSGHQSSVQGGSSSSSSVAKARAAEAGDGSPFQVSIASPESLLIHKRLSRPQGPSSDPKTPTGDRSRANSMTCAPPLPGASATTPLLQPTPSSSASLPSLASKGGLRPSTPTQTTTQQPSISSSSSTSSSLIASRPAWGRAPLPVSKAATATAAATTATATTIPTKATTPTSGSTKPARTRQRTTSVISGRISFLATSNSNVVNAFGGSAQGGASPSEQDRERAGSPTSPMTAVHDEKSLGRHGHGSGDGDGAGAGESEETEDQLSDSTTATITSDVDDSHLTRVSKAQTQQLQHRPEAMAMGSEHGEQALASQCFPDGEDMAVNRHVTGLERPLNSAGSSSPDQAGATPPPPPRASKLGRQSLSLKYLSGRPNLAQVRQSLTSTVSVATSAAAVDDPRKNDADDDDDDDDERASQQQQTMMSMAVESTATGPSGVGHSTLVSPTVQEHDEAMIGLRSTDRVTGTLLSRQHSSSSRLDDEHADPVSLGRISSKRTKLQQPFERSRASDMITGQAASTNACSRPSSGTFSTSESFQSLAASDMHYRGEAKDDDDDDHDSSSNSSSHFGHVLASPAFVKSPVAALKSPPNLVALLGSRGSGTAGMATKSSSSKSNSNNNSNNNPLCLQETTMLGAVGGPLAPSDHEMEVDPDDDRRGVDGDSDGDDAVSRAKTITALMDRLQSLLVVAPDNRHGHPISSSSLAEAPPLDRATLEGTRDRLLQMVGCIQGQLWLMQAGTSHPSAQADKAPAGAER